MEGTKAAPGTFAIATPHHLATEAGERILRRGGSAIDAALAASVVLTVVYPHNCQIGGDLIALLDRPGQDTVTVNSSGAAARAVDLDWLRFNGTRMPSTGIDTVTVPGVVAGWSKIFESAGTMPWSELFDEAISMCEGVPTAEGLSRAITAMPTDFANDPGLSAVFRPGGQSLKAGEPLVQEALGRTLEALRDLGPTAMYGGTLGDRLLRTLDARGSALTLEDLLAHEARLEAPLSRTFRGYEVLTAPPNSQGFVLLGILGALELLDAREGDTTAPVLAALFAMAGRDRDTLLCDPDFSSVPVDRLLSSENLERRARLALVAGPGEFGEGPGGPVAGGDTVAVVASDDRGNSISLIQSVFGSFGSGVLCPDTGILLHNRGASFSLDPESPNLVLPGKRPAHTLMPVMVLEGGEPRFINGTMGGLAQAQIHTHLLLELMEGSSPEQAVSAPRWILEGDGLVLAESRVPGATYRSLRRAGYEVEVLDEFDEAVGHAQSIRIGPDGSMSSGSDPRSDGLGVSRAGGPGSTPRSGDWSR